MIRFERIGKLSCVRLVGDSCRQSVFICRFGHRDGRGNFTGSHSFIALRVVLVSYKICVVSLNKRARPSMGKQLPYGDACPSLDLISRPVKYIPPRVATIAVPQAIAWVPSEQVE